MNHNRDYPIVSTFSIVARDAATGDLGVAVESKFLAVGAVVPWLRAEVGAVATQAHANVDYGPKGLDLLAEGHPAELVVEELTGPDPGAASRQLGVVDCNGGAASFTGPECDFWAGGVTGDGFCCQGNILAGPEVVQAMADAYRTTSGTLAHRLLSALEAGQAAGGDRRGQQSAAIQIVRTGGGFRGGNDRFIDLRVDDHVQPIEELRRLVLLHRVYFHLDDQVDLMPLDSTILWFMETCLRTLGYLEEGEPVSEDDAFQPALLRFAEASRLTDRLHVADGQIDTAVVETLRSRAAQVASQ